MCNKNVLKIGQQLFPLVYVTNVLTLGILPENFLSHLSLLSEAIYLLLGDCVSEEELNRAEILLQEFYKKFPVLYPGGSCGLNVHNAGAHLVHFVPWGDLFGRGAALRLKMRKQLFCKVFMYRKCCQPNS